MSGQKPANGYIRVGSIFRRSCAGECGTSCLYYQVVGLRGKTLVELRKIRTEEYVDGRCVKTEEEQRRFSEEEPGGAFTRTSWDWLVWRRPLPGQFDGEVFTVRVLESGREEKTNCLGRKNDGFWEYYWEVKEDDESIMTGDDGGYARIALKKEGRLPSWAETPHP